MVASGRTLPSVLALAGILFAAIAVYSFIEHTLLEMHVSLAAEQVEIFDEMRSNSANATSPTRVAGFLEYTVHYYPSGTKQVAGSRLDGIVERYRRVAIQDMIERLRSLTQEDLGDDPQAWLAQYAG